MAIHTEIDLTALTDFHDCLQKAPKTLFRELAKAFGSIGRYDIDRIRNNVTGSLNLKSKGAANSFKFKSTNAAKATDFNKLFTAEYTGWKAAEIFQTGGTISGKGKNLTVLYSQARNANGKRKFTQLQLVQMIASRQVMLVPTPNRILIVQLLGGFTKTGKVKRVTGQQVVLGFLKRSVTERKRINFYEAAESGSSVHQELMEYAIENTLAEISTGEK